MGKKGRARPRYRTETFSNRREDWDIEGNTMYHYCVGKRPCDRSLCVKEKGVWYCSRCKQGPPGALIMAMKLVNMK